MSKFWDTSGPIIEIASDRQKMEDKPVLVTTDFGIVDVDKAVKCIYSSCDPDSTNSVNVTLLIAFLKPYFLDNPSEFAELCNLLDPDASSPCVSQKFFFEILSQWTLQITNNSKESSSPEEATTSSNTNFTEPNLTVSAHKATSGYYQLLKNCSQILAMSTSCDASGDKTVDDKTPLELEEKIKQLQHDVHKTTSELEVVRQQLTAAEEQNETLLTDLKHITKNLIAEQKLNDKLQQCKGENDEIKEEYDLAKTKVHNLQMALDNAIKDRQKLLDEIGELENKKLTLENKIELLKKKELEARTLIAELTVTVGAKDAEISSLVKFTEELKIELDQKTELITFLTNEKELAKVENDNYGASLCQDLSNRADSVLTELKLCQSEKGVTKTDDSIEIPEQLISPRLQVQLANPVSPNLSVHSNARGFTKKMKSRRMSLLKHVLLKNASTHKAYDQSNVDLLDQSAPSPKKDDMSPTHEQNEVDGKVDIKPVQNQRYVCSGRTYQGDEGEVLYSKDFEINLNLRSPHKSLREELWTKMGIRLLEDVKDVKDEVDLNETVRILRLELKDKEEITTKLFKEVIKLSREMECTRHDFTLDLEKKDTVIEILQGKLEETQERLQGKLMEMEDQNEINNKIEQEVSALKQALAEEKTHNKTLMDKIQVEIETCCDYATKYEALREEIEIERFSNGKLNRKLEMEIEKSENKLNDFELKLRCICEKSSRCLDLFTLHQPTFGDTSKNLTELDKTISLIANKLQTCCCGGSESDVDTVTTPKINSHEKNQLKMEKLNRKLQELKKDFSRECSNSKQLREEAKVAQEKFEQEQDTLLGRICELSESLSISKATAASLQKENRKLIEDNFQLNSNLNKAQSDVKLKMSIIRNFEENVTHLMLSLQHLERKLHEEKATVANLKTQNVEMAASLANLQQLNVIKAARIGILEQQLETNASYLDEVRRFVDDQCSLLVSSTSEIISVYALEDDVHFQEVKACSNVPQQLQSGILKLTNQIKLVLVLLDVIIRRSMKREPNNSCRCSLQNTSCENPLELTMPSDSLDFSRSLQEFDDIEEHLNEMANQSALPNQTDSFLDSLDQSPGSRSLSKQQMKEKFTALALAFNIDISTMSRRLLKQEKLYNHQVKSHTKCIDCIVNVLNTCSKMQNPQINFALIGLERLRKFTEVVLSTAEHFGIVKYESRSVKCWNLAINYVAILDRENSKRNLK